MIRFGNSPSQEPDSVSRPQNSGPPLAPEKRGASGMSPCVGGLSNRARSTVPRRAYHGLSAIISGRVRGATGQDQPGLTLASTVQLGSGQRWCLRPQAPSKCPGGAPDWHARLEGRHGSDAFSHDLAPTVDVVVRENAIVVPPPRVPRTDDVQDLPPVLREPGPERGVDGLDRVEAAEGLVDNDIGTSCAAAAGKGRFSCLKPPGEARVVRDGIAQFDERCQNVPSRVPS